MDFEEAATQAVQLLKRLEREHPPEGDYVWVDVIETLGDAAIALPDSWFDGRTTRGGGWPLPGRSSAYAGP